MDSKIKHCIINASNGIGWYPKGTERLKRSLIYHGFNGDILTWNDFPNNYFDSSCPYNIKPSAFMTAFDLGYTHVLWLDCSVWAVKDPNPIFDIINNDGYYFWKSGYNAAQTCSDKCLDFFEVNRDLAETFNDCSTSMFGVNIENPNGRIFIEKFFSAAALGVFEGSRLHDNQSQDHRFLFHRQDQSAATMIINKMGLKIHDPGISHYYQENLPNETIFTMRGM